MYAFPKTPQEVSNVQFIWNKYGRCKINPAKRNPYEGCQLNCTFLSAVTSRLIFYMQKTHTAAQLTRPEESVVPQLQCSKLRERSWNLTLKFERPGRFTDSGPLPEAEKQMQSNVGKELNRSASATSDVETREA